MIIKGLDLSLQSSGIATIEHGPASGWTAKVERITSSGHKDDTLLQRQERLSMLCRYICKAVQGADLVLVEGPSYGSKFGHLHDRSGLWWLVVESLLCDWGHVVVEVTPTQRMKYATGKGQISKDAVLAAVVRRYPTIDVTGNDEADALVLAAMGARHLGEPIDDPMPKTHLAAMEAVAWPLE